MVFNVIIRVITRSILVALSLLAIVPEAGAQILWKLKHSDVWNGPDSTIDSSIFFSSLSCSGSNCTAAAIAIGGEHNDVKRITFFYSNDGGISWHEQPCSIPLPLITNSGITKLQQIDSLNVVGIGD